MKYKYFRASVVDERDSRGCYQYSIFRVGEFPGTLEVIATKNIGKADVERLFWKNKIEDDVALFTFSDANKLVDQYNQEQPEFV